jgi:hypothetical protein
MSTVVVEPAAERLAGRDVETMTDHDLQVLLTAVARRYAARFAETQLPACPAGDAISATEAMLAATGLLRAADVQLFELGLWQTFSGIRSGH